MFIRRNIEKIVREAAKTFKSLTIVGPRQAGKTTLARMVFPDHHYTSLENPDILRLAQDDPRGFLSRTNGGLILDEVQRAPELFSYLQQIMDDDHVPGCFILTRSQQLGVLERVTQTLAGRTLPLTLLPFSANELNANGWLPTTLEETIFKGGYPPIYHQGHAPTTWLNAYRATYVERDVRQLLNIRDLTLFTRFLALCAASVGQLLNATRLGNDCGINQNTVRNWLSLLEATYIVFKVQPHYRNLRKRLVKTPKLYFYDSALAARLLGIETPQQLQTHPLRGALFENWVVSELLKERFNQAQDANLFFWRDNHGLEVDVLLESGGHLMPIEIKSGATVAADWFRGLERWCRLAGSVATTPRLIYGGNERWHRHGVEILPWREAFNQILA